jgi:hypothetical protein
MNDISDCFRCFQEFKFFTLSKDLLAVVMIILHSAENISVSYYRPASRLKFVKICYCSYDVYIILQKFIL